MSKDKRKQELPEFSESDISRASRARGRPPVPDYKRLGTTIAFRITPDVETKLKQLANGGSISKVARDLLVGALEPKQPKRRGLFRRRSI